MSFKNKLKKKRVAKFCSTKGKNLINATALFLNDRFSSRLDNVFLTRLNTQRMLKTAFDLGHSKGLSYDLKVPNEFLVLNFLSRLELKVANVLYNAGLGSSRFAIRQLIAKRKIFVNGKKIKSNNFKISKRDMITFDKSTFSICKRQVYRKSPLFLQPRYFEVNYNIFSLVILYEKLDRESRIFLSNKLSKLDFKFLNN